MLKLRNQLTLDWTRFSNQTRGAYFRNLQQALICSYLLLLKKRMKKNQYLVEEKCMFMTDLKTKIN